MSKDVEIMLPLSEATQRASSELEALYTRIERLEHGLDTVVVTASGALDSQSIEMLQELDMLRQSIGALADYLGQLAVETDCAGMVNPRDALGAVPLRDMAQRLAGKAHGAPVTGHAELF